MVISGISPYLLEAYRSQLEDVGAVIEYKGFLTVNLCLPSNAHIHYIVKDGEATNLCIHVMYIYIFITYDEEERTKMGKMTKIVEKRLYVRDSREESFKNSTLGKEHEKKQRGIYLW